MCMIGDDFVEMLRSTDPTARKEHRCAECGRTIGVGEQYRNEVYVFDGEMSTHKTCRHCLLIARPWLLHNCDGFIYGAVYEDIFEHFPDGSEDTPMNVGRILVGMRRKWRRRDGSLMPIPAGAS